MVFGVWKLTCTRIAGLMLFLPTICPYPRQDEMDCISIATSEGMHGRMASVGHWHCKMRPVCNKTVDWTMEYGGPYSSEACDRWDPKSPCTVDAEISGTNKIIPLLKPLNHHLISWYCCDTRAVTAVVLCPLTKPLFTLTCKFWCSRG